MRDLSMHILDIAENSINAGASRIEISIKKDAGADLMTLGVADNGRGMDLGRKGADPFYTSKEKKRFGLGLPLLRQAAEQCEGGLSIGPRQGGGTRVEARFRLGHIDLKPLGDVASTLTALVGGHPEIDYGLTYEEDGHRFSFDTAELRRALDGLPLNVTEVLKYIYQEVTEGIRRGNG